MVDRLDHRQASAEPQVEVVAGIAVAADTATAEAADIEEPAFIISGLSLPFLS